MGKAKRKSGESSPESLTPLLAPLQALQNLLSRFDNQGVIIGGIAASLLGTPRYTVDLDAVFNYCNLAHGVRERLIIATAPMITTPAIKNGGMVSTANRMAR